VNDDNAHRRRRRGVWLGLLLGLSLALAGVGYALSSSPSAPTNAGKPSASPSSQVLAPNAPAQNKQGGTPTAGPTSSAGTTVVLAPAASNGNGGNDNCVEPSNGNGNCAKTFGVTVGQTQTLYPGLIRALPVTYSNPNQFDILVSSYGVSVSVPVSKAAACPASNLEVPSGTVTLNPKLTAPKKGSVATTIPIKLSADAPDGCQLVSFTITIHASAVKK
jgi:hypothetical protein